MKELSLEIEKSLLVVPTTCLSFEEEIRFDIKENGFRIGEQLVVTLTPEQAVYFLQDENDESFSSSLSKKSTKANPKNSVKTENNKVSANKKINPLRQHEIKNDENELHLLTRGPLLCMVLEKTNALQDLVNFIGSSDPSTWTTFPNTLRAKYANESIQCSTSHEKFQQQYDLLFVKRRKPNEDITLSFKELQIKSDRVSLNGLFKFLFPPNAQHPKSTCRLFLFSLYGPLDKESHLRSGQKGLHIVSERELDTMCKDIENEDILGIYTSTAGLTRQQEEEILSQADRHLKKLPQHTPAEVKRLLQSVERDEHGTMSFHQVQKVIFEARTQRINKMKHNLLKKEKKRILTSCQKTKEKYHVAPPSMFKKDQGLDPTENAVFIGKQLNHSAFKICEMEDGNHPALSASIRLIRQEYENPTKNKILWNSSSTFLKSS